MLIAENIMKIYNNKIALNKANISIVPGKITIIIGPSGSGKTTLLKSLSLVENPDSGKIIIDDANYEFPLYDSQEINPPWPNITVVFQQLFLWPHLTLKNNILLPLKNHPDIDYLGHYNELLDLFDMSNFINKYPNETSLGERQRAAIARALILQPKYLLLDEITSSLDVENISKLSEYLNQMKNSNVGILLVTHLIGLAKSLGDNFIFLDKGEIIESGDIKNLNLPQSRRLREFLFFHD